MRIFNDKFVNLIETENLEVMNLRSFGGVVSMTFRYERADSDRYYCLTFEGDNVNVRIEDKYSEMVEVTTARELSKVQRIIKYLAENCL